MRRSGRRPAAAGIAVAALVVTVAGCSHALPLGLEPATQHHLATPIVLQIVRSQPSSRAGGCPAGSATLPPKALEFPGSGQCYRETGKPVTFTSAAVRYVQQPATNQQPANYGLMITVPAADRAALLAITTKAYHSRDPLAIIVAGKTWGVPNVAGPFTGRFEIPTQSANQALQLQRTLVPSA
ncbi:MAG TPA: hypothetical protein VGI66_10235 [Streptosporangiaceae bacterium]